ncbi:MAG TPA: aminotransferase class V-fold PLP-dependent enzyme [Flavobacteriales bacterium]|nr:aminotransferase class V-fold PLP-dependent enzyme [Flavobacteriales bacterium]
METQKIDWARIRQDYPGLEGKTYLDTSAMGLIAMPTADAGRQAQEEVMLNGSLRGIWWQMEGRQQVGAEVAAHLGGEAAGTVLFQSFTAGLTRLGPMLKHRRKVVLFEGDYPTLHGPFTWNGFEVVMVKTAADGSISLDGLAEVLEREKPGLVAISHVQWLTGYTIDLKAFGELCRKHGAWSVVDVTQSWCLVPIDLRKLSIDIIGSSGYKWPLAGFGNGFFHLTEAVRKELDGRNGFNVVQALGEGHVDPVALARLSHALKRSNSWGVEAAFERVKGLCDRAVEKIQASGVRILNGTDAAHRAGILIIEGDKKRQQYLEQHGCPTQLRGAGLRIGIHFYNNEEEVDRFAEVLAGA